MITTYIKGNPQNEGLIFYIINLKRSNVDHEEFLAVPAGIDLNDMTAIRAILLPSRKSVSGARADRSTLQES